MPQMRSGCLGSAAEREVGGDATVPLTALPTAHPTAHPTASIMAHPTVPLTALPTALPTAPIMVIGAQLMPP